MRNLVGVPGHIDWLTDTDERHISLCGREIEVWELSPHQDEAILSAWARHFRQHYVSDEGPVRNGRRHRALA